MSRQRRRRSTSRGALGELQIETKEQASKARLRRLSATRNPPARGDDLKQSGQVHARRHIPLYSRLRTMGVAMSLPQARVPVSPRSPLSPGRCGAVGTGWGKVALQLENSKNSSRVESAHRSYDAMDGCQTALCIPMNHLTVCTAVRPRTGPRKLDVRMRRCGFPNLCSVWNLPPT